VTGILECEIGKMHGLTVRTMTPQQYAAAMQAQAGAKQ
jgi:hypothetical protein